MPVVRVALLILFTAIVSFDRPVVAQQSNSPVGNKYIMVKMVTYPNGRTQREATYSVVFHANNRCFISHVGGPTLAGDWFWSDNGMTLNYRSGQKDYTEVPDFDALGTSRASNNGFLIYQEKK